MPIPRHLFETNHLGKIDGLNGLLCIWKRNPDSLKFCVGHALPLFSLRKQLKENMSRMRYPAKGNVKLKYNPHTSEPSINAAIQKGYFQQVFLCFSLRYLHVSTEVNLRIQYYF